MWSFVRRLEWLSLTCTGVRSLWHLPDRLAVWRRFRRDRLDRMRHAWRDKIYPRVAPAGKHRNDTPCDPAKANLILVSELVTPGEDTPAAAVDARLLEQAQRLQDRARASAGEVIIALEHKLAGRQAAGLSGQLLGLRQGIAGDDPKAASPAAESIHESLTLRPSCRS